MQNIRRLLPAENSDLQVRQLDRNSSLMIFIRENEGFGLLKRHQMSPSRLLAETYPAFLWLPWKFETSPHNWTDNRQYLYLLFVHLETTYKLEDEGDWQRFSIKRLFSVDSGAAQAIKKLGGIGKFLEIINENSVQDATASRIFVRRAGSTLRKENFD